jgi:hypothetical protein
MILIGEQGEFLGVVFSFMQKFSTEPQLRNYIIQL